jgi:hypothetical protein
MSNASALEGLTYRPLKGRDEMPGIARLFNLAGWGPIDDNTLADWFLSAGPLGPHLIMVVVDERDEIVGMIMWVPCPVQLFDRVGVAARGRGLVLDPQLRRSARGARIIEHDHPARRLELESRRYLDERGWELIFGLPNPRLRTSEELLVEPLDGIHSDCDYGPGLCVNIEEAAGGPTPLTVSVADALTPEYDVLWKRAREALDIRCAVLRDATGLAYVRAYHKFFRLECRHPRNGELLGYTVLRDEKESRLEDILAVDDDALHLVARSTVNWLRDHQDVYEIEFFNSVAHPLYRQALVDAGAFETDWIFSLHVGSHHETPREELKAENWYATIGD